MSFSEGLAKKYKNVFSLPGRNFLLLGFIIFGTLVGLINYTAILVPEKPFFGIIDGLFSLAIGSILSVYFTRAIVGEGFLTTKRIFGLAFFEVFIFGLTLLTGSIISKIFGDILILERLYFISCGALTTIGTIIIASTTLLKTPRLFIASISQPFLMILFHVVVLYIFGFLQEIIIQLFLFGFLMMAAISFFMATWYISSIEKVGKKILGYGTLALFRAFIEAIMMDRTGLLEKMLKILAVPGRAEIRIFDFKGITMKGRVVAPLIHPGPFREVGSSNLPTRLALKLKEYGVMPLIFHTPTTHEKDLILSKECDLVIASVLSLSSNYESGTATPSIVKKKGNVTVMCQIFDNVPLVVITRSPIPTEDLPEHIHEICMKKLLEMGYSDGLIVDAHNAMDGIFKEFEKKDEENLLEALHECLTDLKEQKNKVFVGFANSSIEGYSLSEGFGDAGLMVMVVEVDSQKTAYLVFDGNNMIVDLRERLINSLKEAGFSNSEICTTDTHIVVGRKAREGYSPIGKNIDIEKLIKKVVELVKEADSKKERCLIKFSKITLDGLHFLGYHGIEKLWLVANESIKKAKRRTFLLCVLLLLVGVALYVFVL